MSSGIVFTAIAVMAIVGVLLVTLSRSALAGLGVAALVGWRLGRPRINIERTSLPGMLGLIGAVLLILVVFVDVDRWATRVAESFDTTPAPLSRTAIWRESLPIARDFWLTGSGAGTFSDAMIVYQESRVWVGSMRRWAHFNNAHSHYLQVACGRDCCSASRCCGRSSRWRGWAIAPFAPIKGKCSGSASVRRAASPASRCKASGRRR
jgi:O-antigen ligase